METTKELLTKNLKELRKERGWNQEELAEMAGYSTGFIKDIERGKSWVSPEAVEAIANALNVQIERLFKSETSLPTVLNLPVSKTLQKMMKIPDEVYERASKIDINDSIWEDAIIPALVHAEERKRLASLHKT